MHITKLLTLIALLFTSSTMAIEPQTFTFVFILTGPATNIELQAQQDAFKGHFSNMSRMAGDGDLLIAGPYWQPQTWDDMRGMWIFNTDEIDQASELAASDPPGKLGIFVFDILQFKTDDALHELPRLEREDEERRLADPDVPDEWAGRGYFWASAEVSSSEEPDRVHGVALLGTLVGNEDSRIHADHWLLLLDATTIEDARNVLIDAGCDPKLWNIDEWYGSAMPAKLPSFRDD